MFRSRTLAGGGPLSGFSSKIAHTTRFPSLLGNQDLRALQDLITDEKGVVSGLQKLSLDWAKAADALRVWSLSEDDDLGDISTQAVAMLSHISQSLDQFALHEQSVRTHLKDIRSKEEGLDGLRRHRRVVGRGIWRRNLLK
ncbi:uncharacterized protein EI90DRAFT_1093204 [Cantharellus anzutake]|uniref:uncharacterized protein n=1 Tax=Cantharellus anzutake TaxID=1750568 RepID=UPI00190885EE|nr:uncharacterized protein EI90DRAFT_1093204 [Cantharellus anzutake]KAF8330763.1 hypothetical protein EI90DRAFT_1093204 [Cantharellus anzutake]